MLSREGHHEAEIVICQRETDCNLPPVIGARSFTAKTLPSSRR